MRVLKLLGGLMLAPIVATQMALAGDMALILGETGQIATLKNDTDITSADFAGPLREAGFDIVQPKNRSSGNMRLAAQRVEQALADEAVDRLVIVVMGPIASSDRESWAMSNGAAGASSLSIGVSGISIGALTDMAEAAKGPAVILIAPGREVETLGIGLQPGLKNLRQGQDVTYVVGAARSLAPLLADDLLDPDKSYAEIARTAPDDVTLSGFVSEQMGLMGQGLAIDASAAEERGFWMAVQGMDTKQAYQSYLENYPDGAHAKDASDRMAWLEASPEREAKEGEESLNLTRDARRGIQRDLALLGFDPRGIDGLFGPGSRAAIAAWQRDQGVEDTGFLNGNQLIRLRDAARARAEVLEAEAREAKAREERRDRAYWRDTGKAGDEAGLRKYLAKYPDGEFSDIAKERLAEIEEARRAETAREERQAWDTTRDADDVPSYEAFLQAYPSSGFAPAALDRLRQLKDDQQNAGLIKQAKAEEQLLTATPVVRLVIEKRLHQIGAEPGVVDGNFDENTRAALRRYQRLRELPATGYVTRQTMVRLMAGG